MMDVRGFFVTCMACGSTKVSVNSVLQDYGDGEVDTYIEMECQKCGRKADDMIAVDL